MIIHKNDNGGRLGNQLFQIAATIAHAKKVNDIACFPPWNYNQYLLHPINDKLDTTYDFIFDGKKHKPHYSFQFHYEPIPEEKNLILHGFFQSEKYFGDYKTLIKNIFILDSINVTPAGTPVAIHIRRGDYLDNQDRHPVLPFEYYDNAINYIYSRVQHPIFIIFSDDISYCKEIFKGRMFMFSEGRNDINDLALMKDCKHHIIANSSFSWWGAWLKRDTEKSITIAPKNWVGPALSHFKTDDIYCPEWIIM